MWKSKPFNLALLCLIFSLFTFSLFADALEEGTYTVNPDGTGDFESFEEVSEKLSTDGINGPVVIKFAAGTYEGPFQLERIVGTSETNTVTLTSDGYAPSAVFTRPTVTSNSKHILLLLASKNVIIENITFKIIVEGTGWGINLRNRTDNIVIRGCNFISENDVRYNEHIVAINSSNDTYAQGYPASNLTIEGNSFTNGKVAIYVNGSENDYLPGIKILNNKISNMYLGAIRLRYLDAFEVSGNVIEMNPEGDSVSFGLNIYTASGGFRIIGNRIIKARRYGIEFGVYNPNLPLERCHSSSGEMSIVANNMIGGGFTYKSDSNWVGGIMVNSAIENVAFYYNSINVDVETGNYTQAAAILIDNGWSANRSKNIRLVNNSLAVTEEGANGRAFYILYKDSVVEMDYNNYYTNTSRFGWYGSEVNNLSTLKAVDYTMNQNSIVGNPRYLSQFDLHSYAAQLSGMGRPIEGITTDIDGDDRDATNPCIGADEYIPMFDHDIAVIGLTGNNLTKVGTPETVKVKVRNEGRIWQPQYTLYLMRDTGETLSTLEVNEILWQQGDEAEHEMTWVPVAKGIHRLYALVHLEGDENHNNDRYPVGNTFNVMVQDLTELPQPQVSITGNIGDSSAIISWEPIIGANSYKVYASSDPFAENWPLFTTTSNTFASVDMHYEGMLYFRVVASTAQTLIEAKEDDYLKVNFDHTNDK